MLERIEINLLPAEYRFHAKAIFRMQREIVYPVIIDVVVILLILFQLMYVNSQCSEIEQRIADTEMQIAQLANIQSEITRLEQDRAVIEQKIRALERIDVNREKWVRIMEAVCECLPSQMWLKTVGENGATQNVLEISGETYSFPEVASFMSALSASEYFTSVDLMNIELARGEIKTFSFTLSCGVNPDARLAPLADAALPQTTGVVQ